MLGRELVVFLNQRLVNQDGGSRWSILLDER
jgi:hypothetical protein